MRKTIIALALAAASTAAAAQQIYKYATPDGNVVYTDNPAAGLNGAKKLAMPPMLTAAVSPRLYGEEGNAPTGESAQCAIRQHRSPRQRAPSTAKRSAAASRA
jgi:acyl dehydratase